MLCMDRHACIIIANWGLRPDCLLCVLWKCRPGLQIQLAEEILKLGKPTILVLIHGGAMSLGHLKEDYPAIVDAFYGGEMGGELTSYAMQPFNPFAPRDLV